MMTRPLAWGSLLLALLAGWPRADAESPGGGAEVGLAALAGERLEYRVRWGALTVAGASLEVEAAPEGTLLLRATAHTRAWVDPLYPVRDRVESTVDVIGPRPLRFVKSTKEGHGRADRVEVEFDHESRLAHYVENGESREPLALPEEFQDPLSCLYAYRVLAAAGSGEASFSVTGGKRLVSGMFRQVGRERVRTPAGEFDTVVVAPAIDGLGGVFRKTRKAELRIWFTDDAWRRPVRFYSEVAVGSFTMELTRLVAPGDE